MKNSIEPRSTQTKVKHTILEKYLKAWGGIILKGLQRRGATTAHFVYVDCDAGNGRYAGELEDAEADRPKSVVYGSPIVGVQALNSLITTARGYEIDLRVNAILIEKIPDRYDELKNSLQMAGYSSSLRETAQFSTLANHQIALA